MLCEAGVLAVGVEQSTRLEVAPTISNKTTAKDRAAALP